MQARLKMQRSPMEPLVARLAMHHADDDDLTQRLAALFEVHCSLKLVPRAHARKSFITLSMHG